MSYERCKKHEKKACPKCFPKDYMQCEGHDDFLAGLLTGMAAADGTSWDTVCDGLSDSNCDSTSFDCS